MTAEEFRAMGEALFGREWQEPFARLVGINPRTVMRWTSGRNAIPNDILQKFEVACRDRATLIILDADRRATLIREIADRLAVEAAAAPLAKFKGGPITTPKKEPES